MAAKKGRKKRSADSLYKRQLLNYWNGKTVNKGFMDAFYKRGWVQPWDKTSVTDKGFKAIFPLLSPAQQEYWKD